MTASEIRSKIAKKQAQLDKLELTYDELIQSGTKKYRFDSGDGSQLAEKRSLSEIKSQMDEIEAEIDNLNRRLQRKGLTNVTLQRKPRCRY